MAIFTIFKSLLYQIDGYELHADVCLTEPILRNLLRQMSNSRALLDRYLKESCRRLHQTYKNIHMCSTHRLLGMKSRSLSENLTVKQRLT